MSNQTSVTTKAAVQRDGKPGAPATAVNGPQATNGKPGEPEGKPLIPIEPSMMERYSPHHEFPLSVLLTFVLYFFMALVVAVMGVFVLDLWSSGGPPELDNIEFAGGGGDPLGSRDSNVNLGPQEAVDFNPDEVTDVPVVETKPDLTAPIEEQPRLLEQAKKASQNLQPNSFGRGGTGTGGGKGSGHGTGEGDGSGPGKQSKREKRKDRWIISFRYNSGEEYLRTLGELGAYVVIPEGKDALGKSKFRIFEEVNKRPLTGRVGTIDDIKKLNRIYWRDTNEEAVQAIAIAMKLDAPPAYFWAFFPVELENELFEKEKAYKGLTEDQIIQRNLETVFSVDRRGSQFIVKVIEQRRKTR